MLGTLPRSDLGASHLLAENMALTLRHQYGEPVVLEHLLCSPNTSSSLDVLTSFITDPRVLPCLVLHSAPVSIQHYLAASQVHLMNRPGPRLHNRALESHRAHDLSRLNESYS